MSIWMSLMRSKVHSQREQWMLCVPMRNLPKCVQNTQTLLKEKVLKTQHLPSGVHTLTWCKYSFCLWEQHESQTGSFTCQHCSWWCHVFFFAYDRINYARYLPSSWLEMVNLPLAHPSCHTELSVKGQWTVQRQSLCWTLLTDTMMALCVWAQERLHLKK